MFGFKAFSDGEQIILILLNNSDSETNIKLAGDYTSLEIYTTDAKKNCELTFSGEFSKEQALAAKSINTFVLY